MNAGKRLAEQQGVAYAKTVAEAMDLKLDMDTPADREKLRRAVLDLLREEKCQSKNGPVEILSFSFGKHFVVRFTLLPRAKLARYRLIAT